MGLILFNNPIPPYCSNIACSNPRASSGSNEYKATSLLIWLKFEIDSRISFSKIYYYCSLRFNTHTCLGVPLMLCI